MEDAAPDFKIYDDGSKIPDEVICRVLQVTVDETVKGGGIATVRLADESGEFSDGSKFKMGSELKIELGYVGQTKQVFIGEITGWKGAFPRRGHQTLTVIAQCKFHRLRRNRRQKTYLNQKDSEAIEKAAKEAGLTADIVDPTPIKQDNIQQLNVSDADFILARASMFGFEAFVDDKQKLVVRKPKLEESEAAELIWHDQLRHFRVNVSLDKQQKEVQAGAWDMSKREPLTFTAKGGDERGKMGGTKTGADLVGEGPPMTCKNVPASTIEELEAYAKSTFQKRSEEFVRGEGLCYGNPDIRRGSVVKITGIGSFLEGPYYVERAIHLLRVGSGYTTTFHVFRTAVAAPAPAPADYDREATPQEAEEIEPEFDPLSFEVQDQAGAPLGGTPAVLVDPDGKREALELSSDGKVEIEFEE